MRTRRMLWPCLTSLLVARGALADTVPLADLGQCSGERSAAIESSRVLNDAARELSRGRDLRSSIAGLGYRAASAEALYLKRSAPVDDAVLREILVDRHCSADGPAFTSFGTYRTGDEAWIVFATALERPRVEDGAAVAERVLELVNAARRQPRRCGDEQFKAAPPLTLSPALTEAASRHSLDMAQHAAFAHIGSDGSGPGARVQAAGYRFRDVGENIAAGQPNADAVVDAWLESPGHCANVMGARFREMGVAFALAPGNPAIYWTLDLAASR